MFVVLLIMYVMEIMCVCYFNIWLLIVGLGIKIGLNFKVDNFCEIGFDWIVNVVVVLEEYGILVIVVDFGIVIIFCYIDELGVY